MRPVDPKVVSFGFEALEYSFGPLGSIFTLFWSNLTLNDPSDSDHFTGLEASDEEMKSSILLYQQLPPLQKPRARWNLPADSLLVCLFFLLLQTRNKFQH